MQLPIHSYRLGTATTARLVNCYAQAMPADAKAPIILRRSPGIASKGEAAGVGRGLATMGGHLYALIGIRLYRVATNGVMTEIGTIPGTGRVHMAANTYQLVIVANGLGYVCNGTTVAQITDADFRTATGAIFIDNYILFSESASGRFFGSDLADATAYDALNFATAEGGPDNLVTLADDHRQAILFGAASTEIWQNTGTSGFPFERVPNGYVELGIAGEFLHAKQDNSVYWVASDRTARRLEGATPVKVSQSGVEHAWASYDMSGGYAFSYSHEGHLCVCFVFPVEHAAWVYDATTNEWHERESFGGETWKAVGAVTAYGLTWVLASDGRIGTMASDVGTEWGTTIRSEWTSQPVENAGARVYHKSLTLGVEVGGSGSYTLEPTLSLEISNDGGKEWFAAPIRTLGNRGEYLHRVRWDRLGAARSRVYRWSIADDVPLRVTSAELEAA